MPWDEEELKGALSRAATQTRPRPDALDRLVTGNRRAVKRRRIASAASAVALVAAAAVGTTAIWPSGTAQPPGGYASAPGTPAPAPAKGKAYVAFADDKGVWVYKYGTGRGPADGDLLQVSDLVGARSPRWRDGTVYFAYGKGILSEDLRGNGARYLDTDGEVLSFDFAPDLDVVVTLEANDDGVDRVRMYGSGQSETLHEFPARLGRGVSPADQVEVDWSDDGFFIFVVDTFAGDATENTMLLIDATVPAVVAGQPGTQAFWAGSTLYYQRPADGTWWAMNPRLRSSTPFEAMKGGFRPHLSPDGTWVAVQVGTGDPVVNLIELATGTVISVGDSVGAPVWLDMQHLAVTRYVECPDACPEGFEPGDAGVITLEKPLTTGADAADYDSDMYEQAGYSRTDTAGVQYE